MSDEIHHIDASDILLFEREYRVTLLLTKNGNKYIGAADFALTRGLHVKYRAL